MIVKALYAIIFIKVVLFLLYNDKELRDTLLSKETIMEFIILTDELKEYLKEIVKNHPEDDARDRSLRLQMSVHAVSPAETERRKNGRSCALGRVAAFLSGHVAPWRGMNFSWPEKPWCNAALF